MRIWSFCIAIALMLAIGFGVGYYTSDVARSDETKIDYNKQEQNLPSLPEPTQKPTLSDIDNTQASAEGETEYIMPKDDEVVTQGYMVKEYMGRIAVYKKYESGETVLISIVDTATDSLPYEDRENLKKGIDVSTHEQMLSLLEDYTS